MGVGVLALTSANVRKVGPGTIVPRPCVTRLVGSECVFVCPRVDS